jgi:hypothetical protein
VSATAWQTIAVVAGSWACVALIIPLDRRLDERAAVREAERICRAAVADTPSTRH